jgi:hypothetical protein
LGGDCGAGGDGVARGGGGRARGAVGGGDVVPAAVRVWVVLVELVVVRVAVVVVVGGHGELEMEGRWLGATEIGVGWC